MTFPKPPEMPPDWYIVAAAVGVFILIWITNSLL